MTDIHLAARFPREKPVVVVGAGPGGLTAAQQLTDRGAAVVVYDQDEIVGGIAQTGVYKGFRFDIGGHRFFTKVQVVVDLWREMLGAEFLRRPRLSRIYYNGRFFDYPLKATNALFNLGIFTSLQVLASYLWIKAFPIRPEVSLQDWVSNRFGRKLFGIFFKTYTEKVWGIPCHTIGAQWAAQRIKGLSLRTAVMNAVLGPLAQRGGTIKTLIDEFEYPRLGPGQMWEAFRGRIESQGGVVHLRTRVVRLAHSDGRITALDIDSGGTVATRPVEHLISTMPIRELVKDLDPPPPDEVVAAADRLKYRDFLTVALIIDDAELFPDNWIYIHDEKVKVGRIQNFKNWSPDMVPDQTKSCLGLEYFCNQGDELWTMDDKALIELGRRELAAIGLARAERVVDGTVVRMPKAYPVYDEGYEAALDTVVRYLSTFTNLQLVGRNGMHKYNNQDHSMLTAILAVRNLCGEAHDLWAVNADDEYHEEVAEKGSSDISRDTVRRMASTQPMVPVRLPGSDGQAMAGQTSSEGRNP